MTNKEAIAILTHNWKYRELIDNSYQYEALELAIKSLEERPTGHWHKGMHNDMDNVYCRCSVCNFIDYHHKFSKFCENCGADMRGGRE